MMILGNIKPHHEPCPSEAKGRNGWFTITDLEGYIDKKVNSPGEPSFFRLEAYSRRSGHEAPLILELGNSDDLRALAFILLQAADTIDVRAAAQRRANYGA